MDGLGRQAPLSQDIFIVVIKRKIVLNQNNSRVHFSIPSSSLDLNLFLLLSVGIEVTVVRVQGLNNAKYYAEVIKEMFVCTTVRTNTLYFIEESI